MSQKFDPLRQKLETWKSYYETNSSHADTALYEFLNALIDLPAAQGNEEIKEDTHEVLSSLEGSEPGGNNPPAPDIP